MFEFQNVRFNEFAMDMNRLKTRISQMKEQDLIPASLIKIKCKKFTIEFVPVINISHAFESKKNEMNSSMHFEFLQPHNPAKVYKLKMFRTGIVDVPGVQGDFEQSDIFQTLEEFAAFYNKLFGDPDYPIQLVNHDVVMANFVSRLPTTESQRIDLVKAVQQV